MPRPSAKLRWVQSFTRYPRPRFHESWWLHFGSKYDHLAYVGKSGDGYIWRTPSDESLGIQRQQSSEVFPTSEWAKSDVEVFIRKQLIDHGFQPAPIETGST